MERIQKPEGRREEHECEGTVPRAFSYAPVPPPSGKAVTGGYTGDLLSWVMSRAKEGDCWITIMSNLNVAAVAALTDVACVILAENVQMEEQDRRIAFEKGVNILSSPLPAFDLCQKLGALLR